MVNKVRLNQSVNVRFDTFPNQKFTGSVKRISPVADPVARLIPVEVVVPNPDNKLGSGQLARVQFTGRQQRQITIAETALEAAGRPTQPPKDAASTQLSKTKRDPKSSANTKDKVRPKIGTVFVITGDQKDPKVSARKVTLGDRRDGKVAVLSGLKEGNRIVVRSGGKLQDGDPVKLSAISELNK